MKKFLLKKSVVLGLITLLAICFTAANLFPAVRIFFSWWFALLFLFFLLSLVLSTYDQFGIAKAKIHADPGPIKGGISLAAPVEDFQIFLKQERYRELAKNSSAVRYGKSAWGYWGNFILHLGMTVIVLSSALYLATEHRAIIRIVAGAKIDPVASKQAERKGVLNSALPLPSTIDVERIDPTFWENDQLKTLSSQLVFFDGQGGRERFRISVSDKTAYQGMKVYQQNDFGSVFFVEFRDATHAFRMALPMPWPQKRGSAAYGNYDVDGGRYRLKAKYIADSTGSNSMPTNPLLTLRLFDGDKLLEESALMMNGSGRLGPYAVSLVDVSLWTDILFDGSRGIPGIFTGFFLLLAGGCLGYFLIPREVLLNKGEEGYSVSWRAARFADLYREEGARIMGFGSEKHE